MKTKWLQSLSGLHDIGDMRAALDGHCRILSPDWYGRVAILGAGALGRQFLHESNSSHVQILGLYDADESQWGKLVSGQPVRPFTELITLERDVPVIVATHRIGKAHDAVAALGFKHIWPFALLVTAGDGRFGNHPFYTGLWEDLLSHRLDYERLYASVADDQSRSVLDAAIGYRLTFDVSLLRQVLTGEDYFPRDVMPFHDHEIYIDGGAFVGDTVTNLLEVTNNRCTRIYAFEPDAVNFRVLEQTFRTDNRILCFDKGLYSRTTELCFDCTGRMDASCVPEGGIRVGVVGIDEVVKEEPVTFIKLNIEGAESEALAGARQTILKFRPKLAIAAYHRPDHLWSLAGILADMRCNYRFYLRQHDIGIVETVLYAIPDGV
ncbi:MAG: FkbM family methyltransferase [Syntrophales bacterium]|jgi:FkbM family methyltransferase